MKSILDPSFRYTSSAETDLRKTFARIRRENRNYALKIRAGMDGADKVASIFPRRNVS